MFKKLLGLTAVLLFLAACTQPAPPVVSVAVTPADGATNVTVDSVVTATFSAVMAEDTLDDVFTLTATDGVVAGTQSYNAAQRRLTFTPDADLAYGTEYTASVARSVRSTAGGRLAGDATGLYSWTFTTEAEPEETGEVTSVTVAPNVAELELGNTQQLTATVVADEGVDASVTWSSSDEAVATVSASGLVTAVAGGTATITATSVFDAAVSGNAVITVLAPAVTSINVTPSQAAILTDGTQQYLAEVTAISGASLSVTWSSSDPAVATIDEDGLVTAVAAGTTTITATSVVSPSVSGTAQLTVSDVPVVTAITLNPDTAELEIGATVTLEPDVVAAGGADASVTWSSSNEAVATVSASGLVTAVAGGTATITATSVFDAAVSGNAVITVLAPAVTSINVTPSQAAILTDGTQQYLAEVTAISGASLSVTWSSSDPAVATIDEDGLVTAVAAGTTTITATSVATPEVSGSAELTVSDVPTVSFVTIEPATLELELGESGTLTPVVGAVGGADESVTWSSSDVAVATVDVDGLVSAVAAGTATITATSVFDITVEGTADVTVLAEAVTGVAVDPAEVTIAVGDADVLFTATVTTVSGASEEVTWASSDAAVASVDADGLVSAVAAGTASITATSVFDPAVSGTATVNVPGVTDVVVTPASADLILTGTVQLLATATAVHGETDESVTWSSSDVDVATVSEAGLVSAVGVGSVTITATSVATPSTSGTASIDVHSEVVAADYVTDAGYLEGAVLDLAPPVVSGGLEPYAYTMSAGLLPSGVALNPDGSISGTASGAAAYFGSVTVTDTLGQTATADYSFSIVAALELNLYLDDTLTVDTAFAPQSLIAAGGLAPFTIEEVTIDPEDAEWADRYDDGTWSTHLLDEQGDLAPGLDADADTGVVSGTVTAIGFHRTYMRVTDALGQTDVAQLEILVEAAPLVLVYDPATYNYARGGAVAIPVENISVTGGVAPYTFSFVRTTCTAAFCSDSQWAFDTTNGVIARTAGANGVISGIPHNGNRVYTVTVTDDTGTTATFAVTFNQD